MKTFFNILFFIVIVSSSKGQYFPPDNLVHNPFFADYTYEIVDKPWNSQYCAYISTQCLYLNPNTKMWHIFCLSNWQSPSFATPDYVFYDSCYSYGFPYILLEHTGYSRISVFSQYPDTIGTNHEYIQGNLLSELIENRHYCVSTYILFDNWTFKGTQFWGPNIYFTSSMGVLFTDTSFYRYDTQAFYEYYPPQIQNPLDKFLTDSINWMLVSGSFIAEGGEKYITIGNFLPDTLTPFIQFKENHTNFVGESFYFIGFVGVYDCTGHSYTCNAGENKRVCSGEVVQLGIDEDSRRQYQWSPGKGLSDSTAARPLAAPTETTTYYLYVIDEFLQQSYDTVIVEVVNCDIFIPNIFSPNNDGLNDVLYVRGEGISQLSFVIFNRWGEKVFETNDPLHGWDGTYKGKPAETGVYVYMVEARLENGQTVKRSGNVTLVR